MKVDMPFSQFSTGIPMVRLKIWYTEYGMKSRNASGLVMVMSAYFKQFELLY